MSLKDREVNFFLETTALHYCQGKKRDVWKIGEREGVGRNKNMVEEIKNWQIKNRKPEKRKS